MLVGRGRGVFVGRIGGLFGLLVSVGWSICVLTKTGASVRDGVGVAVGGMEDAVGVIVAVGIKSENACSVSAATAFGFEKAKSTTSLASMEIG